MSFKSEASSLFFSDKGIANELLLKPESIMANVQAIQQRNGLTVSKELEKCCFKVLEENKETQEKLKKMGEIPFNFTVEMETGTGKTYVYLRTIYELNKVYGFFKICDRCSQCGDSGRRD